MSDIEKTRLVCEIYKKNYEATAIGDLKIPSLVNNLKSKTLMKLIGFYREKKIPIDIIVLFMDLEKRPFSLFKFVFRMMKVSKDVEAQIPNITNQTPQKLIQNRVSFKGDFSKDTPNTHFSFECAYGDRKAELLKEAQQMVPLAEDEIVLVFDLKCNSPEDANDFKDDLKNYLDELFKSMTEISNEKKLESFLQLVDIQTFSKQDRMICRLEFNYPALLPCVTRFQEYITSIVGEECQINLKAELSSQHDFTSFKNPVRLLAQMMAQPKSDFQLEFNYTSIPSLVKLWMQHLREEAKKTFGPKYTRDSRYKTLVKAQSLLHFLMGNQGLSLEVEYRDNAAMDDKDLQAFIKAMKRYLKKFLPELVNWYKFVKQGDLNSFVLGVKSLQDIVEQLYQYGVFDVEMHLNSSPLGMKVNTRSKGLLEQLVRYVTI